MKTASLGGRFLSSHFFDESSRAFVLQVADQITFFILERIVREQFDEIVIRPLFKFFWGFTQFDSELY